MGRGVSSKNIKKNSDEERGKRKKLKSDMRRRRRRDFSPSSQSTDSEDNSPARKKSSRREPKRARRVVSSRGDDSSHLRKRTKKSDKSKGRKSRHRRNSSVSSTSSSGGSSSRSSSPGRSESGRLRSRSPLRSDRKLKSRVRGRSKGRDRCRRSRYRSCSWSSCSGCSSSHSRSYYEKKYREKDGSRRLRTRESNETERRNGNKDDDRDKIIRAYDDFRPSRSNDGYDVGSKRDGHHQASEKKGLAEEAVPVGKDTRNDRGEDGAYKKGEELVSSKANTQPAKNFDDHVDDSSGRELGSNKDPLPKKNLDAVSNIGSSESEDLELILRQKALENFRRFRVGIPASTISLGDRKDEAAGTEPCKDAGGVLEVIPLRANASSFVKSVVCKPDSSTENHIRTQGGDRPIEARAKSVANPVARSPNDNARSIPVGDIKIRSSNEGQNTRDQLKMVHESSNKMSSEKVAFVKSIQDKRADAEPGSRNNCGAEGNVAVVSASGTSRVDTETQNCRPDKPVAEDAGGSQFERKSFSRMHDGETVQVSYKVYIPKKSSALARRQLQQ